MQTAPDYRTVVLVGALAACGCVQGKVDSSGFTPEPISSPAYASPSTTPSSSPTPTPTLSATPTPTPTPTVSPTPMMSPTPSPMPTMSPTPTPSPTVTYPPGALPVPGAVQLPGLRARVYSRGGDRSTNSPPDVNDFGILQTWMASVSPNFTFLDQTINPAASLNVNGHDSTLWNTFFASDGQGPIRLSTVDLNTTLVDWTGYLHVTVPGNYNFILSADDGAAVYLYGDYGSSGSGIMVTAQNYANNISANGSVGGTGVVNFGSDGNYIFEVFWYNQTVGGPGGAGLSFSVTGPGAVSFYTPDVVDQTIAATPQLPAMTLGMAQRLTIPALPDNGVYNYANDSVFPWLPSVSNPNAMLTFFVDGAVYRTVDPNGLMLPAPNPNTPVLAAGGPGYDANGVWLMNAIRKSDNTLVGLYHAEETTFNSGSGLWASAGVALSADDGNSWTKLGQVVGTAKPSVGAYGGTEVTCMVWDAANMRWLGIGHGYGFSSADPNAAPGTWFGYHNGHFNQPEPDPNNVNTLDVLSGLTTNMAECKLHYNTHLQRYLLLWRPWGATYLNLSVSIDAIIWENTVALYNSGDPNLFIEYAQIMGPTDVLHGQDAWLLYEQRPSTQGRFRDIIIRALHFN